MNSLEESAALKSAMYDRISSRLYTEFDKQFSAQVVRLELEIEQLKARLRSVNRNLAVRDAALARLFDGVFVEGGYLLYPEKGGVYYNLPTGQVSAYYGPDELSFFDYIPRVTTSPWDRHSPAQAQEHLESFARMPVVMNVSYTQILKPLEARNLPELQIARREQTP